MSVINFRDLGGLASRYGTVKKHRLLRSGELVGLDKEDIEMLKEVYKLNLILDFRDQNEIMKRPDVKLPGVQYRNINIMKDIKENATSLDDFKSDLNPQKADESMREIYRTIVINPYSCQAYNQFITNLNDLKDGAALFHCFAGKDRTGIGAAIILTILGVNKQDIFADYLLTNELREEANDALIEINRQKGLSESQLAGLLRLYTVHESYLETMYQSAQDSFGSFENYITEGIGISEYEAELIREQYLD